MTTFTRREVLGTLADSIVVVAASNVLPASAQDTDRTSFRDFIAVSAALTGIRSELLAPEADPTQHVKEAYFQLARQHPAFSQLIAENASHADPADLLKSQSPGVAHLSRSIILVWYLGAWYEWDEKGDTTHFTIVSAGAYTEGWIWKIAQTHAPGFSNLRYGYWAFPPAGGFHPDRFEV